MFLSRWRQEPRALKRKTPRLLGAGSRFFRPGLCGFATRTRLPRL
ncbi:hypothetical protein LA76x_4247 [Lysobacter antibioticus]|uniref:Uncharacterized protein n=1 Tax=Lysobacter antibioticus TaxID=84531 RepID=A0A0S2FFR6_LYSAN|nr:hypothetical protein LA76x_4247 [Lysobacter antibioticus]